MLLEEDLIVFELFVADAEDAVMIVDDAKEEVTDVSSTELLTWSFLDVAEIEGETEVEAAVEATEVLLEAIDETLSLLVDSPKFTVLETWTSELLADEDAVEDKEEDAVAEEEEVEQGKAKGEGEQHGALRPGNLRQAPHWGTQVQAHHTVHSLRPSQDQRLAGKEGHQGVDGQRLDQDGLCPCQPADLHQGYQHLGLFALSCLIVVSGIVICGFRLSSFNFV